MSWLELYHRKQDKSIKIEKRGKYAGVKVHLEPEECEILIQGNPHQIIGLNPVLTMGLKLGKKIKSLMEEEPDLLKERTPEEIEHELEVEYKSAALKLKAIKKGQDWKEIHIK